MPENVIIRVNQNSRRLNQPDRHTLKHLRILSGKGGVDYVNRHLIKL